MTCRLLQSCLLASSCRSLAAATRLSLNRHCCPSVPVSTLLLVCSPVSQRCFLTSIHLQTTHSLTVLTSGLSCSSVAQESFSMLPTHGSQYLTFSNSWSWPNIFSSYQIIFQSFSVSYWHHHFDISCSILQCAHNKLAEYYRLFTNTAGESFVRTRKFEKCALFNVHSG